MRFLAFEREGRESWGVINADGVIDLGQRAGGDLHAILKQGKLEKMKELASGLNVDFSAEGIRYLPPIWLVPGDTVEVEGIGLLSNGVVDEQL